MTVMLRKMGMYGAEMKIAKSLNKNLRSIVVSHTATIDSMIFQKHEHILQFILIF